MFGGATFIIKKIDAFLADSKIQKLIKNTVLISYAYAMQFSIVPYKGFQKIYIFIMIVSENEKPLTSLLLYL